MPVQLKQKRETNPLINLFLSSKQSGHQIYCKRPGQCLGTAAEQNMHGPEREKEWERKEKPSSSLKLLYDLLWAE